jgi:formate dehydrogenase major subunit
MPQRDVQACAHDFAEVETGYAPESGRTEAARCMQCGCDTYDVCTLRGLMQEYGIAPSALRGAVHRYSVVSMRQGIRLDMNKCIRCGRCVRICRDVVGVDALSFIQRGFDTRLFFAADADSPQRDGCDRCAADGALCVDTCPTGALALELGSPAEGSV